MTGTPGGRGNTRGKRGNTEPEPAARGSDTSRDAAEQALLGICLQENTEAIAAARRLLPPTQAFYKPRHNAVWAAITSLIDRGIVPHRANVGSEARAQGYNWNDIDDRLWLSDVYMNSPMPVSVTFYAQEVAKYAYLRRVTDVGVRLQQRAQNGDVDGLPNLVQQIREDFDQLAAHQTAAASDGATELDEFLAVVDDENYEWLIPGLIERGDRLIITGKEGGGKSTLLRQVGVQGASGIHPFTLDPIPPLRVLVVDLENSPRQSRRKYRPLRLAAGERYDPLAGGLLHIEFRAEGIDLLDTASGDGPWLVNLAKVHMPDLLIIGPIYKLASGDPTEEQTAKAITRWLDLVRRDTGCAMLIEAHSPYPSGRGPRPTRPYGASLWSRWPEFGIFLDGDVGTLEHWRGPRDERSWPPGMKRGGVWPWTPVDEEEAELMKRIAKAKARGGGDKGPTARDRILEALEAQAVPATSEQLRSWVYEKHNLTISRQTTSIELNALMKAGFADAIDQGKGRAKMWISGDLGGLT